MPRGVRSRLVFRQGSGLGSSQPSLLPLALSELLPSDHFVRGLRVLVEECLGEELRLLCRDRGGYRHDPVGLFSVWMYGLTQGEATSRKLEEKCRYDVRYSFLSVGTSPDHTTLSRFRDSLADVLDTFMERLARRARQEGLLGSRPVALDGTKVAAASTQWRKALDRSREMDATFLRCAGGERLFGYNMQAATDLESGYVAGFEATAEPTDLAATEPVVQAVERQMGQVPKVIVADKGYDGPLAYDALESRGIVPVVSQNPHRGHPFPADEQGVHRCPAGHVPKFRPSLERGKPVEIWQVSQCSGCALKTACGVKGRQKKAVLRKGTSMAQALERKERADSPEGRQLLRARGPSVERLFGALKSQMGLRRFKLRHFRGARLEFGMGVMAYNLRMLLLALCMLLLGPHQRNIAIS